MLILIIIDVQYLQNVVFSFEKVLSGQNHSFSGSHHWKKKSLSAKFLILIRFISGIHGNSVL